ncbi:hypothetical protein MMC27_005431 [Xylographa pallens]|nr:hypothetical protein [Xylographa pallens]
MRPPAYLALLFHLAPFVSLTLAHPSSPPPPLPASSPATLHRRVDATSHAVTDCRDGYTEFILVGHNTPWVFQQSHCVRDVSSQGPRHFRMYCTDCRAPGVPSMLQGPVHWHQEVRTMGQCAPTQICVDGPYTPPNAALMHMPWYKSYGTAYCVELQHLVDLGRDGLRVLGQHGADDGVAGQAGGGGIVAG